MIPETLLDPVILRRLIGTLLLLIGAFVLSRLGQRLALHAFDEQERQYRASKWISRALWTASEAAVASRENVG